MCETFVGYVSKSKGKVKCKKKENGKYKWNADELSKCTTCDPEKLKFKDDSKGSTDPQVPGLIENLIFYLAVWKSLIAELRKNALFLPVLAYENVQLNAKTKKSYLVRKRSLWNVNAQETDLITNR